MTLINPVLELLKFVDGDIGSDRTGSDGEQKFLHVNGLVWGKLIEIMQHAQSYSADHHDSGWEYDGLLPATERDQLESIVIDRWSYFNSCLYAFCHCVYPVNRFVNKENFFEDVELEGGFNQFVDIMSPDEAYAEKV